MEHFHCSPSPHPSLSQAPLSLSFPSPLLWGRTSKQLWSRWDRGRGSLGDSTTHTHTHTHTRTHTHTHTHTHGPKMANKQSNTALWAVTGWQLQTGLDSKRARPLLMTVLTSIMQFHVPVLSCISCQNTHTHTKCARLCTQAAQKRNPSGRKACTDLITERIIRPTFNLVIIDLKKLMNKTLSYLTIISCRGQSSLQNSPQPHKKKRKKSWVELFSFRSLI